VRDGDSPGTWSGDSNAMSNWGGYLSYLVSLDPIYLLKYAMLNLDFSQEDIQC
jgi:hypothetical protein